MHNRLILFYLPVLILCFTTFAHGSATCENDTTTVSHYKTTTVEESFALAGEHSKRFLFGTDVLDGPVKFAVIGDYGENCDASIRVAELVKSKEPDFIVTAGDNNYPRGSGETTWRLH